MKNIAIITGASSGLGRDFAKELDKESLDEIWIIARRKELLEDLSTKLKTKTKILNLDLLKKEERYKIKNELKKDSYNIVYLVNNAGFGLLGDFKNLDIDRQVDMIELNVKALVEITYFCIDFMSSGSKIIEIASTAGFLPIAHFAVYAASKAFVLNFSNALKYELKEKKISVTAICPGPVKTEFFDVAASGKKPKFIYESSKVVKKALKDAKKGKLNSIYGFAMNLLMIISNLSPRSIKTRIAHRGVK